MMRLTWLAMTVMLSIAPAYAQAESCDVPREARDVWHCENGFVIGPENVIVRLPIPETDPEALYNAGVEAAQREDWRVAIAYFTAAHQRAHLVPRYMYNLGLAHARAGHEVAAVAWLVSYLIAEPSAPNRAEIWAQIATLEAETHRQSAMLLDRAAAAAGELPRVVTGPADTRGARAEAYFGLASAVASVGDLARAHQLAALGQAASLDPSPYYSGGELERSARDGAILDGDLEGARELVAQVGAPESWSGQPFTAWAALQTGGVALHLCETSVLMQRFQSFACPDFPYYLEAPYRAYETAVRSGDRRRILAARHDIGVEPSSDAITLALQGRAREAIARIEAGDDGFEGNGREATAAAIAELLLRTGDRDAEQFVVASERYVRRVTMSNGATAEGMYSGWFAARARALLTAEQGRAQDAVDGLELYVFRRFDSRVWHMARFDAPVIVAQYLIDRGRTAEATPLVAQLDSLRYEWAAEAYPRLFQQTAGTRTRSLENSIVVALTLPGVCYDLEGELHAIAGGSGELAGADPRPQDRVSTISGAGLGLERALRRVRAVYVQAGGTWGH